MAPEKQHAGLPKLLFAILVVCILLIIAQNSCDWFCATGRTGSVIFWILSGIIGLVSAVFIIAFSQRLYETLSSPRFAAAIGIALTIGLAVGLCIHQPLPTQQCPTAVEDARGTAIEPDLVSELLRKNEPSLQDRALLVGGSPNFREDFLYTCAGLFFPDDVRPVSIDRSLPFASEMEAQYRPKSLSIRNHGFLLAAYSILNWAKLIDVWHNWWFNFLFIALIAAVVAVLVRRYPFFAPGRNNIRIAGFLLAHLAVIVILVGVYLDHFRGYRARMNLVENRPTQTVSPLKGHETHGLPFSLNLNRFEVDRYNIEGGGGGDVVDKEYRACVTIVDGANGAEAVIRSNEPLVHREIQFTFLNYARGNQDVITLDVTYFPGVPLIYGGFAALFAGIVLMAFNPQRGMGRDEAACAALEATPEAANPILQKISLVAGIICLLAFVCVLIVLSRENLREVLGGASAFLQIFFLLLCGAAVMYFLNCFIVKRRGLAYFCTVLMAAAWAAGAAFIVERWLRFGHPPFRFYFEVFVLAAWAMVFVYLIIEAAFKTRIIGFFAAATAVIFLAAGLMKGEPEVNLLAPSLRSFWFSPHVASYFLGYAAIISGFFFALVYLVLSFTKMKKTVEGPGIALSGKNRIVWGGTHLDLSRCLYRLFAFGFVALTAGLISGAVWGLAAWGDYWAWDVKEVAALANWMTVLVFLHMRFVAGARGRLAAIVAIICAAAVFLTWLAVGLLPSSGASLHDYN